MPWKCENIAGHRFGKLVVVRPVATARKYSYPWLCRCDCGGEKVVERKYLRAGLTRSCGCLGTGNRTHGDTVGGRSPEFNAWAHMLERCYNPKSQQFYNYGARGITVCDRWRGSFENFLSDMGRRPSDKHSLDRINGAGNYEPSNCRWATQLEQARNTSQCRPVSYAGSAYPTITAACEALGIAETTVRGRIRRGLSPSEAVASMLTR